MEMEKIDALIKAVPLFTGLNREEVLKIFGKGMTMRCTKGETIFFKGNIGNQMFVVLGGKVGIYDGEKHLASMRVGDMFGEMALVNQEPRSATAKAMEDTKLFVLSQDVFERLMTKRVAIQILMNIIRTLSGRLKGANELLKGG